MNKRGDISTILILIAILLALAVSSIIFVKVFDEVSTKLKAVDGLSNNTINTITVAQTQAPKLLDFFIFFTLIAFFIGLIISSIYIDVNPAVLIVFIIGIVIAIVIAGQVTNIFNLFSTQPELASTMVGFPLTSMILGNNFPIIILVIGVVVVVILYGKSRRQGIGGEV